MTIIQIAIALALLGTLYVLGYQHGTIHGFKRLIKSVVTQLTPEQLEQAAKLGREINRKGIFDHE